MSRAAHRPWRRPLDVVVSNDPAAPLLRGVEVGVDPHGRIRSRVDPGLSDPEVRAVVEELFELARRLLVGGRTGDH